MTRTPRGLCPFQTLALFAVLALPGCAQSSPTAPTATGSFPAPSLALSTADQLRTIRGTCETTITLLEPASAGACAAFEAAPSAFIAIGGRCQLSHLGRVTLTARQQVLFQLDPNGQPVIVNGQPAFSALRNCGVLIAANGDELRHTTSGRVAPGDEPGTVRFDGSLTFAGGSGRFESASGAASFSGSASLVTNTGGLNLEGTVQYGGAAHVRSER